MFSSSSNLFPSAHHNSHFDMYDPAGDSNQINDYGFNPAADSSTHNGNIGSSGNANYFLDEASFDESFLSQSNNNVEPTQAINNSTTNMASNGLVNATTYQNSMNAGQTYYGANSLSSPASVQQQQPQHHPLQFQQLQQYNQLATQPSSVSSMYSFSAEIPSSGSASHRGLNNSINEYDIFTAETTPSNYVRPHAADMTSNMLTFFDNQTGGYHSNNSNPNSNTNEGSAGNYHLSAQVPQPLSSNSACNSMVSVSSANFESSQQSPFTSSNYNYTSNRQNNNIGYFQHSTEVGGKYSPNKGMVKREDFGNTLFDSAPTSALELAAAAANDKNARRRYRVMRGVSAGGCTTRPPKQSSDSDAKFLPVELSLNGATVEDICYPQWSPSEKEDRRRIIRIERIQNGPKLIANFSIIGAANENPVTLPASRNVDVVEVSCLECSIKVNHDYDSQSSDDEGKPSNGKSPRIASKPVMSNDVDGEAYQYYITSVEVVEIVELLIGTQLVDPAERRRERGRVRSNLVPFWSRKPISSRMSDSTTNENVVANSQQFSYSGLNAPSGATNQDFRVELAKRIMGYEIRKPRGFDKEVRILRWDKLVPALKRALQCYYAEIPRSDQGLY